MGCDSDYFYCPNRIDGPTSFPNKCKDQKKKKCKKKFKFTRYNPVDTYLVAKKCIGKKSKKVKEKCALTCAKYGHLSENCQI